MDSIKKQNYKIIAILTSALAAGLPLWASSARTIDFLSPSFLTVWLFIGVVAAFLLLLFIRLKAPDMVSSFIVGYMLAVIIYFVGLILLKNLFHSQFLLSLMIAIGMGAISGWIGVLIWSWIRFPRKK